MTVVAARTRYGDQVLDTLGNIFDIFLKPMKSDAGYLSGSEAERNKVLACVADMERERDEAVL